MLAVGAEGNNEPGSKNDEIRKENAVILLFNVGKLHLVCVLELLSPGESTGSFPCIVCTLSAGAVFAEVLGMALRMDAGCSVLL